MKKKYFYSGIFFVVFFIFSNNIKAFNYYLRSNLTSPNSLAAWTQDPTGATASLTPGNFSGTHRWFFVNRASATLSGVMSTAATATAFVGDGSSNFNLTVSGSGVLGGQFNGLIDITSTGTVNVLNNKTYRWNNLDVASTVVFNAASITMNTPIAHYGNVIIATSCNLNGAAGDIYIDGLLTINASQVLSFNSYGIYLTGANGSIAGSGSFSSDPLGFIVFFNGNGGNNGTINFSSATSTINGLYFSYSTGSDFIRLGSNLVIESSGVFQQLMGSFDLNGRSLVIGNTSDISFPAASSDGEFLSTSTSSLYINGSIGNNVPNGTSLFMNPSNNSIGVLSINSAVTLDAGSTININNVLDVTGGATFNTNNNVTLVSTAGSKGRLADLTNGTLVGNLTVQTFAPGTVTDWAVLGVSGIQGQTFNNWYGQIPMTIDGSATDVLSSNGQYFESVQGWNEADAYGYDSSLVVTSPITPAVGYWIYLGTGLTTTADMLWSVSGTPVMGNVNIPLTNSAQGGFNLIANPYPSPISWTALRNGNANVANAIYVYNADLGTTTSFVNGVSTPASASANDVIPMGQGFYVQATSNTFLMAQETNKVSNNGSANPLLRASSSDIGTVFRLNIEGGGYKDDAAIRFHSDATPNFDMELDAHKIYASPGYAGNPGIWTKRTVIATQTNNKDYSINSLPYAHTQNAVIPVVARVYTTGQYTISASDLQNLPPGTCVDLKDNYNSTIHDLTSSDYVCNMSDTTFYARFELTVCASLVMEVKNNTIKSAASILINKDAQGVFVDFDYNKTTNATISVTNILGQKVMDAKKVKVANDKIYLDLNTNDHLLFVTVETDNEKVTKKFLNIK